MSEPTPEQAGSWTGLIIVGAVMGFGGLLFLANFSGQVVERDDRPPSDDMFDTKRKKKAGGPTTAKRSEEDLLVKGPPIERPDPPAGAPNVVFVALTAARRDQLSPYGAAPEVTPFLAEAAQRGVRFIDTIADSPHARAGATAMLTGRHSWSLDMVEPGPKASQKVLPQSALTLAERFRAAGWRTLGVSGNLNITTESGLARGFDVHRDAQPNSFAAGRRSESPALIDIATTMVKGGDADRPFFLQLWLIDAHAPVRATEKELAPFSPDQPNAAYRASLNRMDRQLAELWAAIHDGGDADNTLLVVVADHGEGLEMPPHHGVFHGRLLYESSVVVPWILAGPGVAEGHIVGGLSAHVDVAPTVLELAGLPVGDGLDGMSWAEQARGKGARTTRTRAHSATWHFTAQRASIWTDTHQCQKDFGSVNIDDSFVDACYDRRVDPTFTNVMQVPELAKELEDWIPVATATVTAGD